MRDRVKQGKCPFAYLNSIGGFCADPTVKKDCPEVPGNNNNNNPLLWHPIHFLLLLRLLPLPLLLLLLLYLIHETCCV